MRLLVTALLPLTMACVPVPADGEPEPVGGSGRCDATSLGDLVGQPATQELGAEALRRSGARILRWIRPGDVVTMDYRVDRLNIHLDGHGRVDRLACG